MDRYQRVEKPRPEEHISENEIRVTAQGLIRNYIIYATSLLQDKQEKEVVLNAMGQAISKAVTIAEIVKKRIPVLHQNISTRSTTITDAYEPIEEGLTPVEMKRQVSLITITLSTVELNKNSPGYQAPPNMEQAKVENQKELWLDKQVIAPSLDINQDSYGGRGRGRGQGRGRGRGRVGFQNYQEDGEYYNRGQGGGRGRSWGYQENGGRVRRVRSRGGGRGYDGAGYERGRGGRRGGGRGYGRGRGQIVRRGRGGGDQLV
ncbi:keratin, type II cytoskeletal 1-like [Olea europaea var. sylvestris]|uniref:keratin, type II cytoskeletal 1-like n=1 Tax=Olea europaea var. sylvestris TaxID=158386 RepID=UPI000C1D76AC|nr:keratin, type II cytoskeletal 1-like [Olea europaea var. sylvestris]